MVLDSAPGGGVAAGIEVRRVETFADYCQAADVLDAGFAASYTLDELAAMRSQRSVKFAEYHTDDTRRRYLALVEGRPVAAATAVFTTVGVMLLGGATTLPEARGQGAYRSLVAARWEDALAHGCRALATQVSATRKARSPDPTARRPIRVVACSVTGAPGRSLPRR